MSKRKREKPETFVGKTFNNGNLEIIGICDEKGTLGRTLYRAFCKICSPDLELFPLGYFVCIKGSLEAGRLPCACSGNNKWIEEQYLIKAKREAGNKNITVHGFAEEYKYIKTRVNLECNECGNNWTATLSNIIHHASGCPECKAQTLNECFKIPEQKAIHNCKLICEEVNYKFLRFPHGYKNNYSYFEYECPNHGIQTVSYTGFINADSRCPECWKEKRTVLVRDNGNGNGYYPKRAKEKDFLYVIDFNGLYLKVGRSFKIKARMRKMKSESKIQNMNVLRVFTATHDEVYKLEQEIHEELRERGFQYYLSWTDECFENECQYLLNKLLDMCGVTEIECNTNN